MSSHPWEPDRQLNVEIARSVIRAAFPRVDVTRVEPVGSGWEFDVFVTADGWAFRFPRRAEYQSLFEREEPVLALARSVLPAETAVPLVELTGAPSREFPHTFAGHRYIEGVAADSVHPSLHAELARGIAAALGAIHSVPIAAARAAGVPEANPPGEGAYEWFRRNLAGASQLTESDRTLRHAVRWISELDDPLRVATGPMRFTHNDLAPSPSHLVVEPSTGRLTGILDWTFTALGDAASDFVTCVNIGGWGFVERVLAHYPGTIDDGFHERLRYMARLLSVMFLGQAQQNGGDVGKHIVWVQNAFAPEISS
jgi:aminoglycoside phosphotransferase (APT) family kinase protein